MFMLPQPLSHAKARRRWGFMAFRPCSRHHHLPRRQERDRGGVYVISTPFAPLPPPSHARRWVLCRFVPFRIATTSLACKSKMEVDFYVISIPFALLPPPSHARVSQRWVFRGFRPCSCSCHFPHIQQQVRCGFLWPFDPIHTTTTWLFS